jgi:hypothetical protein
LHAEEQAALTNSAGHANHIARYLPPRWRQTPICPKITPAEQLAPIVGHDKKKRTALYKYVFQDENKQPQREVGVFLSKELPSDSFWTLQSLNPRDQVEMCWPCAQRAQRPVRHMTGVFHECLVTKGEAAKATFLEEQRRLPANIAPLGGAELSAAVQDNNSKPTPRDATRRKHVEAFPCKFYATAGVNCMSLYFKTAGSPSRIFLHAYTYVHTHSHTHT